jgi:hypothetical protein
MSRGCVEGMMSSYPRIDHSIPDLKYNGRGVESAFFRVTPPSHLAACGHDVPVLKQGYYSEYHSRPAAPT